VSSVLAPPARKRHGAAVDPRIRQRRIAVRRSAGRRRLRRLLVLGAVVVLLAGLVALTRSPLLAVRHIRVTGASQTSADAVVAASGIKLGSPLLDVSTATARRKIAALPWVKTVSVRRSFPGTVAVQVTERIPIAVVADGDGWLEVDRSGRVLARVPSAPAGLVPLDGVPAGVAPGGQLTAAPDLLALAAALPATLQPSLTGIAVAPSGLVLQLKDGGVVQLGQADDLPAKLVAAQAVLTSEGVNPGCVAVLDVQVPTAPALTTRAGCA
jgi:cell division protein FtsQ